MVKIRLLTKIQYPRLPGSAPKVPGWLGGVVGYYPLSCQAPAHAEVELGCYNICSWLKPACCNDSHTLPWSGYAVEQLPQYLEMEDDSSQVFRFVHNSFLCEDGFCLLLHAAMAGCNNIKTAETIPAKNCKWVQAVHDTGFP